MTDEAKTQDWGETFWYRGKVTRRRLIGYGSAAAGALGAVSYTHLTLPTNREV